ncbi:MAG: GNAT family N-acetyltransferase [Myxococcota bacterium]
MIRPTTTGDAAHLAHLDADEPDGWTEAAFASSLGLATTHGRLLPDHGFALLSLAADEAEVLRIVVARRHRRRGIGRRLLAAAQHAFVLAGVQRAFLEVRDDNVAAIALYASLGWAEIGRRSGYYADRTDARVLEWRTVTAPRES